MADFDQPPSALAGLAQGLRLGGGMLSPRVFNAVAEEDQRREQQAQTQRLMEIQQTVRGIEMGAIPPEAGQMRLQQLGFKAPVGPGPEAMKRVEDMAARKKVTDYMANLAPEDRQNPYKLADAFIQAGNPEIGAKFLDLANQRDNTMQMRLMQIQTQRDAIRERADRADLDRESRERLRLRDQELKAQHDSLMAEIARGRSEDARVRQEGAAKDRIDRQVTAFANNLQNEKVPSLFSSLTNANNLLKKYEGKLDIPGVGAIEGSKWLPELFRTAAGNDLRSALQGVSNDLLNLYSGLAVTLPESERRQLEEMRGGNFTEVDFKNAWPRIIDRFNTVMGNLRAGASAEVYKEYQSRPGALKMEPFQAAFGKKADAAKPVKARPQPGDVEDGYTFKGGDPSKRENWEKQ